MRRWLLPASTAALLFLGAASSRAEETPAADAKIDPRADKIVHAISEFYGKAHSVEVTYESRTTVRLADTRQETIANLSFSFEKPNRFALKTKAEGIQGSSVISNGKKQSAYAALTGTYEEGDAPESLLQAVTAPEATQNGLFALGLLASFFDADPYKSTMDGVTAARYVGVEKVGEAECDHLSFTQEQGDWDMWVDRGPKPLLRKESIDLTSAMKGQAPEDAPQAVKGLKALMTLEYGEWAFDKPMTDADFQFQAPAGAKSAASAPPPPAGGASDDEESNELQGKPGPEFTLDLLDGGKADLAKHHGNDIVVLDFWATWCGPCARALPILAEVTAAYRDKGVVFYAVDQREDAATITDFLKKKKLEIAVALDSQGKVGEQYGVEGIPQTVILDKSGTVQAVHVGFSPDLKQRLTRELDALIAGKSLAGPKASNAAAVKGMESAWALPGKFGGVAADGGKLIALGPHGSGQLVDGAGKIEGTFTAESAAGMVRSAHLSGKDARDFVCFESWGPEVQAYDSKGTLLWKYTGGEGIDDVWTADLNGDGVDEVIVGYNGGTGVHVLSEKGKLLWKSATVANVWHVCAGDLQGGGKPSVLTTSAQGNIHVFDATGTKSPDLKSDVYANMVRFVPGTGGQPAKILIAGTGEDGEIVAALDTAGKKLWALTVADGKGHVDCACVAPGRPWLAVSLRGGRVLVIDTDKGAVVAESNGEAPRSEVSWVGGDNGPLLVVTGKDGLHAYRVAGQ